MDPPFELISLVKNHGIPEEDIANTIKAAKQFFALPESTKMGVRLLLQSAHNNYSDGNGPPFSSISTSHRTIKATPLF